MIRKTTNIQAALRRHLVLAIGATAALTAWMTPASDRRKTVGGMGGLNQPSFMCDTALLLTDGTVMGTRKRESNHE